VIKTIGSVYASCTTSHSFQLSTSSSYSAGNLENSQFVELFQQGFFVKNGTLIVASLTERSSFIIIVELVEDMDDSDEATITNSISNFTDDVGIVLSAPLTISDRQQVTIWGDGVTSKDVFSVPSGYYHVIVRGRVAEYIDIEEFPELKKEYDEYWLTRSGPVYVSEGDLTGDPEIDWSMIEENERPAVFTITFIPTVDFTEVTVHLPRRQVRSIEEPWQT
jgi:hypothetical protein